MSIETLDVLGIHVSAINMQIALDTIATCIQKRKPAYITVANIYSIMTSYRESSLRDIHNQALLVTPDGMPLVWLSKWYGYKHVSRVYGPDLLLAVCQKFSGYSHFFYGGDTDVAEHLISS